MNSNLARWLYAEEYPTGHCSAKETFASTHQLLRVYSTFPHRTTNCGDTKQLCTPEVEENVVDSIVEQLGMSTHKTFQNVTWFECESMENLQQAATLQFSYATSTDPQHWGLLITVIVLSMVSPSM